MYEEVKHKPLQKIIQWQLKPVNRDKLLSVYQFGMNVFIKSKSAFTLRMTHRHLLHTLVSCDVIPVGVSDQLIKLLKNADVDQARAAVFRICCQIMRYLTYDFPCDKHCCCGCEEAYENIACNLKFNNLIIESNESTCESDRN